MNETPSRPVVRWFGGKWKLAPWIISHFGGHHCYVEPFGGGASVARMPARDETIPMFTGEANVAHQWD